MNLLGETIYLPLDSTTKMYNEKICVIRDKNEVYLLKNIYKH